MQWLLKNSHAYFIFGGPVFDLFVPRVPKHIQKGQWWLLSVPSTSYRYEFIFLNSYVMLIKQVLFVGTVTLTDTIQTKYKSEIPGLY